MEQSTEKSLRESEERFRVAQELTIDGFSILTPKFDHEENIIDFIFIFQNAASAKMNGTTPERVIGKGVLELFPGIKDTKFFHTFKEVFITGKTIEFEDHYKGESIVDDVWFRIVVVPTRGGVAVYAQDITEKKEAEESAAFHAALLSNVNDAVIATDQNFIITYWNRSAEELFGWNANEAVGQKVYELLHTKLGTMTRQEAVDQLLSEGFFKAEAYYLSNDGTSILTEVNSSVLHNANGAVTGVVTIIRDIRERKKTEEALKESEEKFRALADNISQLAWMADSKGCIFWYNKRWYDYTGTTLREMQDTGWEKVHHPDHVQRVSQSIQHSWDTGEPWEDTFPIRSRDGNYRWFLSRALPIKNEDGKIILWFGTNTDITELKASEEARLESEEKLLEAQHLSHMCSFIFDFEHNRIEWTKEFLNIFELDSPDQYPSIEKLMELVHPDDRNYVRQYVKEAVENKKDSFNMEYRIVTSKGNVKFVQYRGKLSYDEKGQHTRRFGTIVDVTDRKLQELELRNILENLERSNKDLEQFAYVASHDLQEPLRMVSTYSTILQRSLLGSLDEKNKVYFDILLESSKRMHSLITGLLEYSSISSKKENLTDINMNDIAAEVQKDLSFLINETKTELIIEDLPRVKANPTQMKILLQNLISNAIKFRAKNVSPCIEVRGEKKEKSIVFSVKDNGIGISPEDYERIFVIFHRLHAREVYSGTGLGLSLCKRIVESHGGRIWVESELDKGAAFYFSVPDIEEN